ncbi:TetR family transcriptional regulator [Streptomyces sp. NPDC094049]|uniref:TetR family transcriptional regulator n=1 Tax=Streptomyces sp. NPDC094049 TaxID=3154987 RepID=UPI003323A4A9
MADRRPGLREQKLMHTRTELARFALELFVARGYDETTVDDIVAAVEVSQRTFFRYFPRKEDAALFAQQVVDEAFVAALAARPPDEGPAEAVRRAAGAAWGGLGNGAVGAVPVVLYLRALAVVDSTPALLAADLLRSAATEAAVARVLAAREGVDAGTDPRPQVAAAVYGGVMRAAIRAWSRGPDRSLPALCGLLDGFLEATQGELR